MTVKELKEQIKNLNDDVQIYIDADWKIYEFSSISKHGKRGRSENDKDCFRILLNAENGKDIQVEHNPLH